MDFTPLSSIAPGNRIRIASVPKNIHKRLLSLGLPPGTQFSVLRNRNGSVVIGRHHDRMAIGRALAEQIQVQKSI